MSSNLRTAASAVLLATTVGLVAAQPLVAARPAASAASAAAPNNSTSSYRSAFEGYRPFTEQPVTSWRAANDQVGQIGGWQAYAREGQGGAPAGNASAPTGATKPAMPGIEGDGMARMPGMSMTSPKSGTTAASDAAGTAPASPASASSAAAPATGRKTP